MKSFFVLILVGSMLMAGCDRQQTVNEEVINEDAPAATEQESPFATDDDMVGLEAAVGLEEGAMEEEAMGDEAMKEPAAVQEQETMAEPAAN